MQIKVTIDLEEFWTGDDMGQERVAQVVREVVLEEIKRHIRKSPEMRALLKSANDRLLSRTLKALTEEDEP